LWVKGIPHPSDEDCRFNVSTTYLAQWSGDNATSGNGVAYVAQDIGDDTNPSSNIDNSCVPFLATSNSVQKSSRDYVMYRRIFLLLRVMKCAGRAPCVGFRIEGPCCWMCGIP